jgi:GNAT superfamily N-acetyltransferase
MTEFPPEVTVVAVPPGSAEGAAVLTAYFCDIVGRYHGRPATTAEVAEAMAAEPSDDLTPPDGLLLVARQGGTVIGCAGLRLLPAGIGEVVRVFVMPCARSRGVGGLLMRAVEEAARERAVRKLRLDSGSHLTEAQRLYARTGYREVPAFNAGRLSDRWYEKPLG